ncbi:MAG TPA: hypothetical protein VGI10_16115 [Polyangiaceae bacterium]|jgi:hypothetical protein
MFGGGVALCAALIERANGPELSGLLLSFPVTIPATLMLIEEQTGRRQAAEDARGACLGGAGLASFGATVWALSPVTAPSLTLLAALAAWTVTCALLWRWRGPLT